MQVSLWFHFLCNTFYFAFCFTCRSCSSLAFLQFGLYVTAMTFTCTINVGTSFRVGKRGRVGTRLFIGDAEISLFKRDITNFLLGLGLSLERKIRDG